MEKVKITGVAETMLQTLYARASQIARSAMDEAWTQEIEKPEGKVLAVIEGLTMYLTEADVQKILSFIAAKFPNAEVIVETMNPLSVKHFKEKTIESTTAKFTWGIKNGKELTRLAPEFEWVRDVSLTKGMKIMYPIYHLIGWIPVVKTISNQLVVLRGRRD